MTFNKMEQLLYFSICFFSNVLIINYLPNVSKYTHQDQSNDRSTLVVLVLRYKAAMTIDHCFQS